MQYTDFDRIQEIGSDSYRTIYTARCNYNELPDEEQERVVLKRFKNFDHMSEFFIHEVSKSLIRLTLSFF